MVVVNVVMWTGGGETMGLVYGGGDVDWWW